MDIQAEKLRLIEWLASLKDSSTISELIAFKKSKEADWWDEFSSEEKAEIEEGLAQADRGEVVPYKQVMAKYNKWR
ncbi:hypothetical protein BXY85_3061 [Roseivirga pacifica]|uniref:Addiction module component n=1 Tax=Roseivirga pacifica TaxID=1267423 RepID=A0A1I0QXD7_9BACT|nr:hypothetical protein [Roseivirga pacifica]RKQ42451.1 hypothetical protein BXY85_3061 [Roseivirga pacifica]SEW32009.1 hypothetical protein SAMN05216290_2811 [Roseivirga pacifica]